MWSITSLVRSAATSKPSVATEDDTFLALRRIPFKDMDVRLDDIDSEMIRQRLFALRYTDKANLREKQKQKWFWILDLLHIKYNIIIYRTTPPLEGLDPSRFEGTGWTPEDYVAEVKKNLEIECAHLKAIELLKLKKLAMWTLLVANIGPWVNIIFGPFPIGIILGLSVMVGLACGWLLSKFL